MTLVYVAFIFCVSFLIAQQSYQNHRQSMLASHSRLDEVEKRVARIERVSFDAQAFDELKSKVEAIRIAQGLKR